MAVTTTEEAVKGGKESTPPPGPSPVTVVCSPGSRAFNSVSDKSRADYSIYTIRSNKAVVAVLMTTHVRFSHALGQV